MGACAPHLNAVASRILDQMEVELPEQASSLRIAVHTNSRIANGQRHVEQRAIGNQCMVFATPATSGNTARLKCGNHPLHASRITPVDHAGRRRAYLDLTR